MSNNRRDAYILIEGVSVKRDKRHNKPGIPDPQSNRSKKRAARGWVSLEQSSRIHKRAMNRQLIARTIEGKLVEPGETRIVYTPGDRHPNEHRGGGAVHFWKG